MELTQPIESINLQLTDLFGIDTITGLPLWRVVFSEDQYEKRLGTYDDFSPAGLFLRTVTEVRLVPKYKQWIHQKYVLERLVVIPEINSSDLPGSKMSYEPLHVFETASGKYLPPRLDACQFVINSVYAAQGKGSLAKYKDPFAGLSSDELAQQRSSEIDSLQEELFGNESYVGDALAHNEAIVVPHNYKGES